MTRSYAPAVAVDIVLWALLRNYSQHEGLRSNSNHIALQVVRKSSTEATQLPGLPRASRGSPFASRLIRTAYPRPTFPGATRGRLPLRGGARSLQWKRGASDSVDAGKPSQTTPAAPGNQLVTPTTRSFTYTRTEPKPNDGAMAWLARRSMHCSWWTSQKELLIDGCRSSFSHFWYIFK